MPYKHFADIFAEKKGSSMFAVNDKVVHSGYGICRVRSIGIFGFLGHQNMCYVLTPLFDDGYGTTYYVPVEQNECLREPLSREQILAMIDEMPKISPKNMDLYGSRTQDLNDIRTAYQALMDSGSVTDRIILLKTIYTKSQKLSAQRKRISEFESHARDFCERMLYGEIAGVMDIPVNHVEQFITRRIEGKN